MESFVAALGVPRARQWMSGLQPAFRKLLLQSIDPLDLNREQVAAVHTVQRRPGAPRFPSMRVNLKAA
jgi:hypothetical protein